MAPKWFSTKSLPYGTMWADDPYWLPLVLDDKKIKAGFVMDKNDAVTRYGIEEVDGF